MRKTNSAALKNILRKKISKDQNLELQTRAIIEKQFKAAHRKLLTEFESHPVTKELKGGPGGSNVSGGLSQGNLFGFIGFDSKYDPIKPIEEALRQANILIKRRKMGNLGMIWTYAVNIPSLQELYQITPMPWARGLSWLQEIEGLGIPNLGQYLYKDSESSRSTAGIQSGSKSSGRIKIPYIKPILKAFEISLNSISASKVSKSYF